MAGELRGTPLSNANNITLTDHRNVSGLAVVSSYEVTTTYRRLYREWQFCTLHIRLLASNQFRHYYVSDDNFTL